MEPVPLQPSLPLKDQEALATYAALAQDLHDARNALPPEPPLMNASPHADGAEAHDMVSRLERLASLHTAAGLTDAEFAGL